MRNATDIEHISDKARAELVYCFGQGLTPRVPQVVFEQIRSDLTEEQIARYEGRDDD